MKTVSPLCLAWLLLAGCVDAAQPPSRAQQPAVEKDVSVQTRLQFRFKSTRSLEDIDPSRIAPEVEALSFVVRYKIYDDRLSDADFVTLVVELHDPTPEQLTALRDALAGLPDVHAFAVNRSGDTHLVSELPIEQLLELAATDALAH